MAKLTQSQSILLGKALERCLEPALIEQGISFRFSESYEEPLTRPDYLIYEDGKPIAAVAVTCTRDTVAMNMKRWRYIDEVAQLKSYFGPDFLVINCEFGNPSNYKASELLLEDTFFDSSILVFQMPNGQELLDFSISEVKKNGATTDSVVDAIKSNSWGREVPRRIIEYVHQLTERKSEVTSHNKLYSIWKKDSCDYRECLAGIKRKRFRVTEYYLRQSVMQGMIVGDSLMKELIVAAKTDKPISEQAVAACKRVDIRTKIRMGKPYIDDIQFKNTITAGLSYELFLQISNEILGREKVRSIIEDLQDDELLHKMVIETLAIITDVDALSKAMMQVFRSGKYAGFVHNRVWILDIAADYLDLSMHDVNTLYMNAFGREQIANIIEQFVTINDIGKAVFAQDEELERYCSNLATIIVQEGKTLSEIPTIDDVQKRFFKRRLNSLGHQPFANPLQRYLEIVLKKHKVKFAKSGVTCALNGIEGLPASMQKIREIYQIKVGEQDIWIKVVAGYDGVKDKTREMAARARLLQYSSPDSEKRNVNLVFVTDGKWSEDLQQLLSLSGWKNIVPIFEFEKFILGLLDNSR